MTDDQKLVVQAWNFGLFADDYDRPLTKDLRLILRRLASKFAEDEATASPPAGIGCRYCYDVPPDGCEICNPRSRVEAVTVGGGKYTVMHENGRLTAFRNGERWDRELLGDKFVLCMMQEILALKKLVDLKAL